MDLNRPPDDSAPCDPDPLSESDVFCSICLEPATDDADRTVVKLKCKHKFHLDCIGSAFNAKRGMECPNCRTVEKGDWQFSNGVVPTIADQWNHEEEEDEELISEGYSPPLAISFEWCPFDDVAPVSTHFNEWNILHNSYTPARVHQWSGPLVPAEVQEPATAYAFQGIGAQHHGWENQSLPVTSATIGGRMRRAELNSTSAQTSVHPFPSSHSVSQYYQGMQPGVHAVQSHYYQQQQQPYIAPLPNPAVQTLSDSHGPLTVSGFRINSRNARLGFFTHSQATPLQNFVEPGFPTPNEHLQNQASAEGLGSGNILNRHLQWGRQGHETTTWPYQP